MEMTGEQRIPAPPEQVWAALNDPEVLRDCIPGCESVERASEAEYRVAIVAAVGPVKAKFSGRIVLDELDPPKGYRITFDGAGGPAGFAKGGARVSLAPDAGATLLTYTADAQIGGKLAQVGSRLVDAVARKTADDFFRKFNARFAPAQAEAPADARAIPGRGTRIVAAVAIAMAIAALVAWLLN